MCIDLLKRLPAFAGLGLPALENLATGARCVRLPAGRWLVRPGRVLAHHYYLIRGRVRVVGAGAPGSAAPFVVSAGSALAREPVCSGGSSVETLAVSEFLRLSREHCEDLLAPAAPAAPAAPGVPEVRADDGGWQTRFLMSPLLQRLEPPAWQRILRATTLRRHEAGERVIAAGAEADCCYVLCAGRAEVRSATGRTLAALAPGALFGEDALISGGVRNASVWMCSAGATVSLPAGPFEALLLNAVVHPRRELCGRRLISLDPAAPATLMRLAAADVRAAAPLLSREQEYGIVGGTVRERALAAFLLAQFGIDADPSA